MVEAEVVSTGNGNGSAGGRKGEKFRALKAREAAAKAAQTVEPVSAQVGSNESATNQNGASNNSA